METVQSVPSFKGLARCGLQSTLVFPELNCADMVAACTS